MRKYVYIAFILLLVLCGCEMNLNNTPTKQAEIFLGKYQTLHKDVLDDLNRVVAEDELFNSDSREEYRSIMKKHYQDLEYEIKEEKIDGDNATVIVQIEVNDYTKIQDKINSALLDDNTLFNDEDGNYDYDKYLKYRLSLMKNIKDRVQYTLELKFTKKDKKWVINPLTEDEMDKINGIYK